ncbi:hypothetical protein chiPu_0018547 [Chiloscyllium punctatum]|uniref:Ras-related protein Rab-22A n=1 Tax=Chiloscyllium punctatum TaxID=137246 RepID=A0A401RNY8_CHIPU|nr:hypothetical protein [Chiloscyllium punctatum]
MALRELKVCLLGDTGVGKSSIVWRFVEDSFDPNINPTIGASFMTKTVQYQSELHKFLIWDTAGQERGGSVWTSVSKVTMEVLEKDAKDYADSIHAIFVETSAKNAININELFAEISRRIPSTAVNPATNNKGFKLRRQPSDPKRNCC